MILTKLSAAISVICLGSQCWTAISASGVRGNGRTLQEDATGIFLERDVQYAHDGGEHNGDQPQPTTEGRKGNKTRNMSIEMPNGMIYSLENMDPSWEEHNGQVLKSGSTRIKIGRGATISGSTIDLQGAAPAVADEGSQPDKGKKKKPKHRLLQSSLVGDRTILAVRVVASDASYGFSEEHLREKVFDDDVNLVSQYNACSYGQFNLTKAANRTVAGLQGDATTDISGGVVTVQVSSSTSQGDGMMVNDISRKITSAFGVQPSDLASHVLYCLPPNTMTGIAYAYIGSWLSVYSNEWCNYLSTQMHEVGHNLGFGHSGEDTRAYGDQSGMMGYSYSLDDGPISCFNGAKSYQSGWYGIATKVVTPTANENTCFNGALYGVADFELGNGSKTVVVKINDERNGEQDFFVAFNRRVGINSGSSEGGDQVLITTAGGEGNSYSNSLLLAKLSAGERYTISSFGGTSNDVVVRVDSIDTGSTPGSARVSIEYDGSPCDETFSPTASPTACPGKELTVNVRTDGYPTETSWELLNECTGQMETAVAPNTMYSEANSFYTNTYCLSEAKYTFAMRDAFGDGLCCTFGDGSYSVVWGADVVAQGGQFARSEETTFGSCEPETTSSPSSSPTPDPTAAPSSPPSRAPSTSPTSQPSRPPTKEPTAQPSSSPTLPPVEVTSPPSANPTTPPTSAQPTSAPTALTANPTRSTSAPTSQPTFQPTPNQPTQQPSPSPTSSQPTSMPTTAQPTPTPLPTIFNLPRLQAVGDDGWPRFVFPLGECQGDCDNDDDCEGSLVCFQRDGSESVPGCSGSGASGVDYCFRRPSNYLLYTGNNMGTDRYGLCEGDCDSDTDCEGSLVCEQRDGLTEIAGCEGTGIADADYCRLPDPGSPTRLPTPQPTSQPTNAFDCSSIDKRKDCRRQPRCDWKRRACVNDD